MTGKADRDGDVDLQHYGIAPLDVVTVDHRRGGAEEAVLEADDDDVLEVVFDSGLVDVLRAGSGRGELLAATADGRFVVRPELADTPHGPARGIGRRVVREVRRYRVPSIEDLVRDGIVSAGAKLSAAALARGVVAWNERQFAQDGPAPGVHRVGEDLTLHPLDGELDATDGPYLVLIHGTFSSTQAAFGALQPSAEWDQLVRHYGERILALEHRTLSVNPVHNAIELLTALPAEVRLHLVTHSRGGIVGDLVSAAGVTEAQLRRFRRARRDDAAEEVDQLRHYDELCHQRRPAVERFVRVAAPSGGTLLASRRLDLYLKVMLNVVGLGFAGNPAYGFVKALALHLAERRADVDAIPGLEAQMPESPHTALLATMPEVDDGLAVVAGDVEGSGLLGRLKILATDLYYREDHDLVVNTRSMYGGAPRTRAFASFQKGPAIAHSSYFGNEVTRARMRNWLLRGATTPPAAVRGFEQVPPQGWLEQPDNVTRAVSETERDVVAFVPAQLTTALLDGGRPVWPDVAALATDGLDVLAGDLTPGAILDAAYQRLLDRMAGRFTVVPVPWDWRADPAVSGAAFATELERLLDATDRPVSVVAHSGGGLLPLWVRRQRPDLWSRVRARAGRLVLLGTPWGSCPGAARWFVGAGDLPRQLALLDPDLGPVEVGERLRRLPGLAALARGGSDLLDAAGETWADVAYITGTAASHEVGAATDGFAAHDGIPQDLPTWHAPVPHADLGHDPSVADGVVELLTSARTAQLHVGAPTPPAAARSGAPTLAATPDDAHRPAPTPFPTPRSLIDAALGDLPRGRRDEDGLHLRVEVLHGSVDRVGLPVMIGHYTGSTLEGATAFVDRQLAGRLSERQVLGMFPEEAGSALALTAPDCTPPGAIVLGLGPHGELTSERLVRAATAGALHHATAEADRPQPPDAELPRPAPLAAVLVGSSGREGLSIEASLAALVKGVVTANTILQSHGVADRVRIGELRIVELYTDRAEVAAQALRDLEERLGMELGGDLTVTAAPYLGELGGGMPGQPPGNYDAGQWRRIRVTGERDERAGLTALEFVRLGGRAGTDSHAHRIENANVDDLLAEAVRDPRPEANTRHTLYELLLPTALKNEFQEADNLQLLLDADAAQYPWELLAGRSLRGDSIPLALRSGMLRQLQVADARAPLRAPSGRHALVVGDPPATPRYQRLPAARTEAQAVADVLEAHGYAVTRLIGEPGRDPTWSEVLNALFARDYRIVHIASHGQFVPDDPASSGIVIGSDRYLTATTVNQMPTVPELVFLNCCHLGRLVDDQSAGNLHRFAASVSQALIGIGVRAVVAAGWAVHDRAAAAFAQSFYDAMVQGHAYGEAVRGARWRAHDADGGTTATWGAYQCYGDPSFRLRTQQEQSLQPPPAVAWPALIRRVDDLRRSARHELDVAPIAVELDRLEQSAPAVWRHAELYFAFGRAWGALGDYRRAIDAYTRALEAWDADAPLKVMEQLGNMQIRLARTLDESNQVDREALLENAYRRFHQLRELAPTPERHALLGSYHKKRACLVPADQRPDEVRAAADAYAAAAALAHRQRGRAAAYQVCNELQLRHVGGDEPDGWQQSLDTIRTALPRAGAGFWDRVAAPDLDLTEALLAGTLPAVAAAIGAAYRDAFRHGSDRLERLSVVEHLDDLAELVSDSETARALRAVRSDLEAAVPAR